MEFLKSFFGEDKTVIGLCGFGTKKQGKTYFTRTNFLFNDFQTAKTFETDFESNVLLL